MDEYLAKKLEKKLSETNFEGYRFGSLINYGKSAAVFKVRKNITNYALKIFDNDLIERFGHQIQTRRIEQEIELKDHNIDGMVGIHDGGSTTIDREEYYFLIMDYVSGKNLKQFIEENEIEEEFVLKVLKVLYEVTEVLLERGVVHRDIKPENIMVNDLKNIVLMDFGVLKLVGTKSFTDIEEKQFTGTLRYASPEYLSREEKDDSAGWRALNLYQIGGVLHDLINREILFKEEVPYAKLVVAINDKIPKVQNPDINHGIIQLTRNLLCKDPDKRIQLNNKDAIFKIINLKHIDTDSSLESLEKLKRYTAENIAQYDEIKSLERSVEEKRKIRTDFSKKIKNSILEPFENMKNNEIINSFEIVVDYKFDFDRKLLKDNNVNNYMLELSGSREQGFVRNIYILVRVVNNGNCEADIMMQGILPSGSINIKKNSDKNLLMQIEKDRKTSVLINSSGDQRQEEIKLKFKKIFSGVLCIDENFKEILRKSVYKLLTALLSKWKPEIDGQIELAKMMIEKGPGVYSRVIKSEKNLVVCNW